MIQIPVVSIAITMAYSWLFEHLEIKVWYEANTVDQEIFPVKFFLPDAKATKIKCAKVFLLIGHLAIGLRRKLNA